MKIIVVSDTHGTIDEFIGKINNIRSSDLIIHLGDYVEDGEEIEKKSGIKTVMVKGNGDIFNKKYNEDEILEVNGRTIFLTHGHRYSVRYGITNLLYKAEEVKADIVLFGHTHVPVITEESNIKIMNPGSASFPRGFQTEKTYGIIEIDKEIQMSIKIIK